MNKVLLVACTLLATPVMSEEKITATFTQGWISQLSFKTGKNAEINLYDNPIMLTVPSNTFVAAAWGIDAPIRVTLDTNAVKPDNLISFVVGKTEENKEFLAPDTFTIQFTPSSDTLSIKEITVGTEPVELTMGSGTNELLQALPQPNFPAEENTAYFYPGHAACITINISEKTNLKKEPLSLLVSKNHFIAGAWGLETPIELSTQEGVQARHNKITFNLKKAVLSDAPIIWFSPNNESLIIHELMIGDKVIPVTTIQPEQSAVQEEETIIKEEKPALALPSFVPFVSINSHAKRKRIETSLKKESEGLLDINQTERDQDILIQKTFVPSLLDEIIAAQVPGVCLASLSKDNLHHTKTYNKIGWKADNIYLPFDALIHLVKTLQEKNIFVSIALGQPEGGSFIGTTDTKVATEQTYFEQLTNILAKYPGVGITILFENTIFYEKGISAEPLFKAVTRLQKEKITPYPVTLVFPVPLTGEQKKKQTYALDEKAQKLIKEALANEVTIIVNLLLENLASVGNEKSFSDLAKKITFDVASFLEKEAGKSSDDLEWGFEHLQITPRLGKTGPKKSLFTEKDAQEVATWAHKDDVALSLWSLAEDHAELPERLPKKKKAEAEDMSKQDFLFSRIFSQKNMTIIPSDTK